MESVSSPSETTCSYSWKLPRSVSEDKYRNWSWSISYIYIYIYSEKRFGDNSISSSRCSRWKLSILYLGVLRLTDIEITESSWQDFGATRSPSFLRASYRSLELLMGLYPHPQSHSLLTNGYNDQVHILAYATHRLEYYVISRVKHYTKLLHRSRYFALHPIGYFAWNIYSVHFWRHMFMIAKSPTPFAVHITFSVRAE